MRYIIDVPDFEAASGVQTEWEENSVVSVVIHNGRVTIKANGPGLWSLARHCLTLAHDAVPSGRHLHLDDWSGLAKDSAEMTIERA